MQAHEPFRTSKHRPSSVGWRYNSRGNSEPNLVELDLDDRVRLQWKIAVSASPSFQLWPRHPLGTQGPKQTGPLWASSQMARTPQSPHKEERYLDGLFRQCCQLVWARLLCFFWHRSHDCVVVLEPGVDLVGVRRHQLAVIWLVNQRRHLQHPARSFLSPRSKWKVVSVDLADELLAKDQCLGTLSPSCLIYGLWLSLPGATPARFELPAPVSRRSHQQRWPGWGQPSGQCVGKPPGSLCHCQSPQRSKWTHSNHQPLLVGWSGSRDRWYL